MHTIVLYKAHLLHICFKKLVFYNIHVSFQIFSMNACTSVKNRSDVPAVHFQKNVRKQKQ